MLDRVGPALVRIHVVTTSYEQGRELKSEASGSGVIISPDGYLLSNHHVAGHATRVKCTLYNLEEVEAELVGTDALSDISVLRLKSEPGQVFPYARFGDSDSAKVGERVLALGSPMALSQSATFGIISNTRMVMPQLFWPFNRFRLDGEDVGSIVRWIAHDADIYGGNSGGPLVNLNGEIIGINEIRFGLSGAIPGNLARQVSDAIRAEGRVRRAWLGLYVQPLLKHENHDRGVLVAGALPESPADLAGLQPGDVLLSINGRELAVRFDEEIPDFNLLVAALPVGEPVRLSVLRGDEEVELTAVPQEREEAQPRERELKTWGITARDLTLVATRELKLPDRNGVLVTSVRPGGPCGAAKPAIQEADVIRSVAGEAVTNLSALVAVTEKHLAARPVPLLVGFQRGGDNLLTVVEVGLRELEDPGLEARKAWLPVRTQVITRDVAGLLGRPGLTGVRVTQVHSNSTASSAGFQVGDLITAIDGEPIPASQPEDYETFPAMVRRYRVGSTAEFSLVRGEAGLVVPAELAAAPKLSRQMAKYRDEHFEFTARDMTLDDQVEEQYDQDTSGVVVTEVVPGGWAAVGQLAVDDLIQEINAEPVRNVDAVRQVMLRIEGSRPEAVTFRVMRGIHTLFLELEPSWDGML